MRPAILLALAALLPGAASAGSMYSVQSVPGGGGNLLLPQTGGAGLFQSGDQGAGTAALEAAQRGAAPPYAGYTGYSGYSSAVAAARPGIQALQPQAVSALGIGKKQKPLRHRFAFGIDSLPALSLAQPTGALVAVPNALSVRWWATDRLAVDLLAGGNYNSAQPGKGELSPVLSTAPGNAVYAGGLGLRYNLAELSRDLLSQVVVKVSGAQAAGDITTSSNRATQTTLAVFVGAGFEAFLPGLDWLSVEASAGVTGFSESLTPQGSAATTVSGVGLAGSGFSPFNLAAHVYF